MVKKGLNSQSRDDKPTIACKNVNTIENTKHSRFIWSKQQKNYQITEIIKNIVINTKYVTYTIKTNEKKKEKEAKLTTTTTTITYLKTLSINWT